MFWQPISFRPWGSVFRLPGWIRVLIQWGRDKMDASSQTTFSNAFFMKIFEFWLKFTEVCSQLTISQHSARYWLGVVQANSHYLNQWWLVYRRLYASLVNGKDMIMGYIITLNCLIFVIIGIFFIVLSVETRDFMYRCVLTVVHNSNRPDAHA